MNNKGFAITTILYGTLILFLMLFLSMMGILNSFKGNLEKLIDSSNGARDIVTMKRQTVDEITRRGLYCDGTECKYVAVNH